MYGLWISPEFKEISAGVAIFLFGMVFLEDGFKAFSGGILEKLLTQSTDKLWKSLTFGAVSTALMQSSSLVSVLTISFLSAGLVTLAAGIGIIFGANIGTTTGAWLISAFGLKVNIAQYAMPMLVFGIVLHFQSSRMLKGIGSILAGLGFLFLGIHYMKEGFETFKDTIDLTQFAVTGYKGLFIFTGLGVFATVVMQSSHATLVLIITALAAGQITYENALALAIGANIGTTITAILGALSANMAGKRLAMAHLIFNVVTAFIAIGLMPQFILVVEMISIKIGFAANDYTMKLAVFHTVFNMVGVLVMVPFIQNLVTFLESTLKDRGSDMGKARHLNESALELPDTALKAILRETRHLYANASELIAHGLGLTCVDIKKSSDLRTALAKKKPTDLEMGIEYQKTIKGLYGDIIRYATLAQSNMSPEQLHVIYQVKLASRDIVNAVKGMVAIQENITKYLRSDNESIRSEYSNIRIQVATVLKTIHELEMKQFDPLERLTFARKTLMSNDILANGTLDGLVRQNLISSQMASSLMNDSAAAYTICNRLLDVAEHYMQLDLRGVARHQYQPEFTPLANNTYLRTSPPRMYGRPEPEPVTR
jgi:phosphate:Na+ symporter